MLPPSSPIGNFFDAIIPSENKRHDAGAACDANNMCSIYKQLRQRFSDYLCSGIVRVTLHAACRGVPVLQGLRHDSCVRLW